MQAVLLIVVLVVLAYFVQKYTTKCPNCGAVGQYKNLGRRLSGSNTSRNWRKKNRNNTHKQVIYNERYQCTACDHKFSKQSRRTKRR